MKINDIHAFKQPVEALTNMYFTRDYHEEKYRRMGAQDVSVLACEDTPSRFSITVRYTTQSDAPVPDFAKRFLGTTIVVTQTDVWDRKALKGHLDIDIKGVPGKVTAEMQIKPDGKGSANHFVWTVSCGIPLVGGKLEKVLAEDVRVKTAADHQRSAAILNEQSPA